MLLRTTYRGEIDRQVDAGKRHRIRELYEKNAANDPAWRRALRGIEFFSGEFETAGKLAHELAAEKNPQWGYRDATMAAIIDRILGNPQPLREVIEHCPQPPAGFDPIEHPEGVCREVALNTAHSYARIAVDARAQMPPALRDMLIESIQDERFRGPDRMEVLVDLKDVDPAAAERQLMALLQRKPAPPWLGHEGYRLLALTHAAQRHYADASQAIDAYLDEVFVDPGWTPEEFATFEAAPAYDWSVDPEAFDIKAKSAIAMRDFAGAQRALERMIAIGAAKRMSYLFWADIADLVKAEIQAGNRDSAMRVVGWMTTKTLDDLAKQHLADLKRALAADPPPQTTPWDAPARKPATFREPPPARPTVKT